MVQRKGLRKLNLGNNEFLQKGVVKNSDGTYTGLRFSSSKTFKTRKGAEKYVFG